MKKRRVLEGIIILCMLILVISDFMYWANKKEVTFCDEFYSYEMANAQKEWCELYHSNVWRTGEWLNNYIAATEKNMGFGIISQHVRTDHVPLYTWICRIVSVVFFFGSSTKWIGLFINLVFLIGIFGEIAFILHKTAKQSLIVSAIGAAAYCLHPLILNSALTIRMYLMFQCILIFMMIVFTKLLCGERNNRTYIELIFISIAGFLTHKYIWLCLVIFSFLYCLWLLKKKEWRELRKYIVCMFVVGGAVTLLFPYWLPDLFVNKGARTLVKVAKFWKGDWIKEIIWGISRILIDVSTFGWAYYQAEIYQSGTLVIATGTILVTFVIVSILLLVYLINKKERNERVFSILGIVFSLLYTVVVAHAMPITYEDRYIWPVSGIILLIVMMAVLSLGNGLFQKRGERLGRIGNICMVTLIYVLIILSSWNGRRLSYVNGNGEERKYLISQHKEIPCVVYCESLDWQVISSYWDYILFDNVCWLEEKEESDQELKKILEEKEELIVYIKKDENYLLEEYDAEKLFESVNMDVYLVKTM